MSISAMSGYASRFFLSDEVVRLSCRVCEGRNSEECKATSNVTVCAGLEVGVSDRLIAAAVVVL